MRSGGSFFVALCLCASVVNEFQGGFTMILKERFEEAWSFEEFLATAEQNRELWRSIYERVRIPEAVADHVAALPGRFHLLVLGADWCIDAFNVVPVVARLAERAPNLKLRHLDRDENLDLMDAHLTRGARSIPVVIVLDEHGRELGWWGPRPRDLQEWFYEEGREMPGPERYRYIRAWHARDRGETVLAEIVELLEGAVRAGALRRPSAVPPG